MHFDTVYIWKYNKMVCGDPCVYSLSLSLSLSLSVNQNNQEETKEILMEHLLYKKFQDFLLLSLTQDM